jgi:hypothetical protein
MGVTRGWAVQVGLDSESGPVVRFDLSYRPLNGGANLNVRPGGR